MSGAGADVVERVGGLLGAERGTGAGTRTSIQRHGLGEVKDVKRGGKRAVNYCYEDDHPTQV